MNEIDMVNVVQNGSNRKWKSHTVLVMWVKVGKIKWLLKKPYSCSNVIRHSIVDNRSPTFESIVGWFEKNLL